MSIENAELALSKAKINLLIGKNKSAFIATIVYGLKTIITDEVPTAATNGIDLLINPDFFCGLSAEEQITLVAHEAYHVALSHVLRLGDKDMKVWNIAADFAINLMLKKAGFRAIKGWLCDDQYADMGADEIYQKLMQSAKPLPEAPDHLRKPTDESGNPVDEAIAKQKIDKLIAKAATQAKMSGEKFGDMPGDLQRAIDAILNPKLDWRTILMNHLSNIAKEDYSYRRPNKRFMPDYYLPSLYSESLGSIGVAFDASASVSDEDFAIFKGEVALIESMMQPECIDVISFDTKIQSRHVLKRGESINGIEFKGYGGTSLKPVFKHFNKNKPEVLIVFSDLECTQWTEQPDYPVIWILVGHYSVPQVHFGTLIEYVK